MLGIKKQKRKKRHQEGVVHVCIKKILVNKKKRHRVSTKQSFVNTNKFTSC